ncbi:MAG: 5-formyltetrahydrofolate cyclo-ligase [Spongiibacteraceae bacterium]
MKPAEKTQLRAQLRAQRQALSTEQQNYAARRLFYRLLKLAEYRGAKTLAAYLANDGEISLTPLLCHATSSYLPVVNFSKGQGQMDFYRYRPGQTLSKNRFGIAEPACKPQHRIDVQQLDIILLPLVGFDRTGGRLGMGGGFYDRSLAFKADQKHGNRKPLIVGIAHHCQEVEQLPREPWDIPLDLIITDRELIRPHHR